MINKRYKVKGDNMNDTYIIPEVYDDIEKMPDEDDTAALAEERSRQKKEGRADDIIAMQTAVCLLTAIVLAVLNIFRSDIAGELFEKLSGLSADTNELFRNPIYLIMEYIGK